MKKVISYTIFLLLFINNGLIARSISYYNTISFSDDYIHIKTNIESLDSFDMFILNNEADSLFIFDELKGKDISFTRTKDTISLNGYVKEIQVSYILQKKNYSLSDGSIILKNESKWYPYFPKSIIASTTKVLLNMENYYVISAGYNPNNNMYEVEKSNEISLIVLDRSNYKLEIDSTAKISFYSSLGGKGISNSMKEEFVKSNAYFSGFFNTQSNNLLNVIYFDLKEFMICQSLKEITIFGDNFVSIHNQNPMNSWIPHEVCHQWWGKDIFLERNISNYRFLEESITEYLKTQYVKASYGDSTYRNTINQYKYSYNYIVNDSNRIAISEVDKLNNSVNAVTIYCRGTLVLEELSTIDGFNLNELIKSIYKEYKGEYLNYMLFKKQMLLVLSEKDIALFEENLN